MKRYYNIPFLGKRLLNRIAKREGGEKESITLNTMATWAVRAS